MEDASSPIPPPTRSVPYLVRHVANQRALPDLALALLTGDDLQAWTPDEVPDTGLAFDVIDLSRLDVQGHGRLRRVVDGLESEEIVIRTLRRRSRMTVCRLSRCRARPELHLASRHDVRVVPTAA